MFIESYSIKYNLDNSIVVGFRCSHTKESGDFRGNTYTIYYNYFQFYNSNGQIISCKKTSKISKNQNPKLICNILPPPSPQPIEFIGVNDARECDNILDESFYNLTFIKNRIQKINNSYKLDFGLVFKLNNESKIIDVDIESKFWQNFVTKELLPSYVCFEYKIDENSINLLIAPKSKEIVYQDKNNYIVYKNHNMYSYNEYIRYGKANNVSFNVIPNDKGCSVCYEDGLVQEYNKIGMNTTFLNFSNLNKTRGISVKKITNSSIEYYNLFDLKIGGKFGNNTEYLCRYHEDKSQIVIYSNQQSVFYDRENKRHGVTNIEYNDKNYRIITTSGKQFCYNNYGENLIE